MHPINHKGRFFITPGPFISEPSPARVPVLMQAGGSARGQAFAARHAEVVFVIGADDAALRRNIAKVKLLAAAEGRAPDAVQFVTSIVVVTGASDAEAAAKLAEYQGYFDADGAVVHYSASTNVDFSGQSPETPIRYLETRSSQGLLGMFSREESGRDWTLGDALAPKDGFGRSKLFVGSGETVARALDGWAQATGLDGFNIQHVISPASRPRRWWCW